MINLKHYPDSIQAVFTKAVSKKQDASLRKRLEDISPEVFRCYSVYKEHFDNNQLELIKPDEICEKSYTDLISLYSFKRKVIKDLKKKIDETQLNIISNTCQNCTISSVNTMDHVLGQAKFPEFAVNALNLFPSCSECNGYKSDTLLKDGNRKFLNLYLDQLPEVQYLFVNIKRDRDGDLIWDFEIKNSNGIDNKFFDVIKSHYDALYLPTRMKVKSIKYVTEVINSINVRKANLPLDKICEEIIQVANENRKIFGYNHFQYILETSLATNKEFLSIF